MTDSLEHIKQVRAEADCLVSIEKAELALDSMAAAITARHQNNNPLIVCVMNGGLIVTGCLLSRLDFPLEQDYMHATRYRGETRGGELRWLVEPQHPLKNRHVLIVDDILDEGYTLAAIVKHCQTSGAASVETAVLVEKMHNRKQGLRADYVGMELEDRYLFGYGMDYKGYLRNAPGIFAIKGVQ
jgi:hypoxanthine phosphoribosyltransferase